MDKMNMADSKKTINNKTIFGSGSLMKIVVLHGQQHKRNTYKLTQMFLDKLKSENDEVKEFYVNDIHILP